MGFDGFPVAALDFYDDLEMDNTRTFWAANRHIYEEAVRAPMQALTSELAEEFGEAKLFRPQRDVRFAKDKTPIKTQQGAYTRIAQGMGYYVAVSAAGVYVGGGFYEGGPTELAAIRRGISDERRGTELEGIVADLTRKKFTLGGERLKTAPRGFDKDHPRIDLLRQKAITVGRDYGDTAVVSSPTLVEKVREDWRALTPLIEWFSREFT